MEDHKANRFKMDCEEFEQLMKAVTDRLSDAHLCVSQGRTEAEAHDYVNQAAHMVARLFVRMHMVIEYAARYTPDGK